MTAPVLYVLPETVEVGGELGARGVEGLVVLAFGLAEELFPPFRDVLKPRIVGHQKLDGFAFLVKGVPRARVLQDGVLGEGRLGVPSRFLGPVHEGGDVDPTHGEGQQSDGRDDAVAPADVVGDDELLVALAAREFEEFAALAVGRGDDKLLRTLGSVTPFEFLAEEPEGEGGFGGGARLRDYVDGERLALEKAEQLRMVASTDLGAGVDDERGAITLCFG